MVICLILVVLSFQYGPVCTQFSAAGICWEANSVDNLFSYVGSPCVCFRRRKLYTFP
jgi:hypothetical protein